MGYNFLRTKDLLQKVKNHKILTFIMLLPHRHKSADNCRPKILIITIKVKKFGPHSVAPESTEDLKGKELSENGDNSKAKGFKLLLSCAKKNVPFYSTCRA